MRELTVEQEQRVQNLHKKALIINSLGSAGALSGTEEVNNYVESVTSEGKSFIEMLPLLSEFVELRLFKGKYPKFRDDWYLSGVDAVSVTIGAAGKHGMWNFLQAVHDIAMWQRRIDTLNWLEKVTQAKDFDRIKKTGNKGVILNFQNAAHIEGDLNNLNLFHALGVRIIQLTYNSRNLLGDGCTERAQAGLSRFGLACVERMNELGILIDVSHCGEATTLDAIRASDRPVAVTHSACKAAYNHVRGKSDEVLEAIAENNGYFGVCLGPVFLTDSSKPCLDHFMKHFNHAVNITGSAHVGFGTDFDEIMPAIGKILNKFALTDLGFTKSDGIDPATEVLHMEGYKSFAEFPNLIRAFVAYDYSDEEIKGFLGGNFRRVFEQACG